MSGTIAGLRVAGGTDKWGLVKVEDDWGAGRGSPGWLPVEPKQVTHVEAITIDPGHTTPVEVVGQVISKGVGLWMPNSGRDVNYVNVRVYQLEVIHPAGIRQPKPPVADMRRAFTQRVFPTVGAGSGRHFTTALVGGPYGIEDTLQPGEALTVFFGLAAEVDRSNDNPQVGAWPLLKHWHGGQVTWDAYTTGKG